MYQTYVATNNQSITKPESGAKIILSLSLRLQPSRPLDLGDLGCPARSKKNKVRLIGWLAAARQFRGQCRTKHRAADPSISERRPWTRERRPRWRPVAANSRSSRRGRLSSLRRLKKRVSRRTTVRRARPVPRSLPQESLWRRPMRLLRMRGPPSARPALRSWKPGAKTSSRN